MKVKTSELIGTALDWAVAKCEDLHTGYPGYWSNSVLEAADRGTENPFAYSTKWTLAGPIIERGHIHTWTDRKDAAYAGHPDSYWVAEMTEIGGIWWGPTPLIAAMRCYVANRLGDEVDVPEELT